MLPGASSPKPLPSATNYDNPPKIGASVPGIKEDTLVDVAVTGLPVFNPTTNR